jgi:hypothetical protein
MAAVGGGKISYVLWLGAEASGMHEARVNFLLQP